MAVDEEESGNFLFPPWAMVLGPSNQSPRGTLDTGHSESSFA